MVTFKLGDKYKVKATWFTKRHGARLLTDALGGCGVAHPDEVGEVTERVSRDGQRTYLALTFAGGYLVPESDDLEYCAKVKP